MISLKNITKIADKKRIIDEINADFPDSAVSLLIAPKNAGKTTFCKVIAGELLPDSGKILKKRGDLCAFADKTGDFFPDFTINECCNIWNLLYPSFNLNTFDTLVSDSKISHNTKIQALSPEQKKLLKISLVFSSNAEIMVFDEPLQNLDREAKDKTLNLLKEYALNGKTVIVAAEETDDFESIVSHIFVLNNGDIVLSSGIKELLLSHRLLPGACTISPDFQVVGPVFNERLVKTTEDVGRNATLKEIVKGYINGSST